MQEIAEHFCAHYSTVSPAETRGQVPFRVGVEAYCLSSPAAVRLSLLDLPQVPQHLVQRGNNRQALSFHDDDHSASLAYLRDGLLKNDCMPC